ncbi:phospholipase [Marivirga arenosa]|uniref:Phospholipase n=1 Tax=Marivirga arenosa TaxID=3059076 RepID=A0AA51ZWK3_9BACT|nr:MULTISPECIES: phospholipase [unclassified Marivirga]WMN07722.1 phospholipase [Marivirga sp. ABR2-2]WNB18046.1 phospholipase [Marivirga sp. BKB1-2]
MQSNKFLRLFSLVILSVLVFACNNDDDLENEFNFQHVVSYEFLDSISTEDISARFGGNNLVGGFINFDITAHKITYMTENYDGTEVEASGLILIPIVQGSAKLTSFQHSTLAKDANPQIDQENRAPSYLPENNAEIHLSAALFAANGYMISAPDYIGYGSTGDMFHPYEHAQTTATTSYDMLIAAREYAEFLEVKMRADDNGTEELHLLGYSQGGNSTMALHKYIEETQPGEFNIIRSAMGAGAYHKSAVGNYIFNFEGELGFSISLYLWVMDTYDRVYLQRGLDYYLNEPYATEVENGGYFALSNTNPQEIFTTEFIDEINDPNSGFSQALADNNVHDWKANAPIKLYHSRNDGLVPYFNSVDAYENLTANGSEEVLFETYEFGSDVAVEDIHGAGGGRFFSDVLSRYFLSGI